MQKGQTHTEGYAVGAQYAVRMQYTYCILRTPLRGFNLFAPTAYCVPHWVLSSHFCVILTQPDIVLSLNIVDCVEFLFTGLRNLQLTFPVADNFTNDARIALEQNKFSKKVTPNKAQPG